MLTNAGNGDTLAKALEISRTELGGRWSWSELLAPAFKRIQP